jgi:hypothetical protein
MKGNHMKKKSNKNKSKKKKSRKAAGDDWGNISAKQKAFLKIMHDIIREPVLGEKYLGSDQDAAQAFRDAGMDVPRDVKVVFVPAGDTNKLSGGSAVIELPSAGFQGSDDELMELFLCTYSVW